MIDHSATLAAVPYWLEGLTSSPPRAFVNSLVSVTIARG